MQLKATIYHLGYLGNAHGDLCENEVNEVQEKESPGQVSRQ